MKKEKKKSTFWKDFKAFISRGNIVDMAIGVVVANAFKDIVNKFTAAFISPLVALLTDGIILSDLKYIVRPEVLAEDGTTVLVSEISLAWGALVQSIIDFLIIALALFIVIRIVTRATARAKELRVSEEEKAAAAKAAEEAAAKAEAEKKAAEAAAVAKAAEEAAAKAREIETVELLREISKSLKK